jgi:hypothetical protein
MSESNIAKFREAVVKEFNSGDDTFIYDFSIMSVKQILAAETLFKMHAKLFSSLPATPSELMTAVERNANARAFGALLVRKTADGAYESFNPAQNTGYDALGQIFGPDFNELEKCRKDFFFNMKIASRESTMQSADLIQLIAAMDKESLSLLIKAAIGLPA